MLDPLYLETRQLRLNPFGAAELSRYRDLVTEVFELFSDAETLHFIPEKKLDHLAEADQWLKAAILSANSGRNVIHLITDKSSGRLVGIVDIIPPRSPVNITASAITRSLSSFTSKRSSKGKP